MAQFAWPKAQRMFSALYIFPMPDIGLMSLEAPDASRNFLPGAAASRNTVNATSTGNPSTIVGPRVLFLFAILEYANEMLLTTESVISGRTLSVCGSGYVLIPISLILLNFTTKCAH